MNESERLIHTLYNLNSSHLINKKAKGIGTFGANGYHDLSRKQCNELEPSHLQGL